MIELQEVKTGKQRKEFVDFPIKLYRDDPNYMPGVFSDSLATITPEKNKAFNFCEARFWLAKRDGETVGRIGAIINHRANEKWDKNSFGMQLKEGIESESLYSGKFNILII